MIKSSFAKLTRILDTSTHLYKRICPAVGESVGCSYDRFNMFDPIHSKSAKIVAIDWETVVNVWK